MAVTKQAKAIYAKGKKAYDLFNELRDICFGDESTSEFDRLHDDLYYQAVGINESLYEAREDARNNGDISGFEKEFDDALKLARDIKRYHKQLQKLSTKNFNWIYG